VIGSSVTTVGTAVGADVGTLVGAAVGADVGALVGAAVGADAGALVGAAVGGTVVGRAAVGADDVTGAGEPHAPVIRATMRPRSTRMAERRSIVTFLNDSANMFTRIDNP
jgi:Rickettsia 17 kDa surface antigen.